MPAAERRAGAPERVNLVFTDDAAFAEGVPVNFKGSIATCQVSSAVKYVEFSPARDRYRHCRLDELGDAPGFLPIGLYGHPLDWLGRATPDARSLAASIPDLRPMMDAHRGLRVLLDYSYEAGFGEDFFGFINELVGQLKVDPSRVVLLVSNTGIGARHARHLSGQGRSAAEAVRVIGLDMFLMYSAIEFGRRRWHDLPESIVSQAEVDSLRRNLRPFKFASLNRRPRWQRFILALMIGELGLRDQGRVSMSSHAYRGDWSPEAHQMNVCGPLIGAALWERLQGVQEEVFASLPWIVDQDMDRSTHVHAYLWDHVPRSVFLESYAQVIAESYMDGEPGEVFITEKTCKAIGNLQPFIVFGNAGLLNRLERLGFQPSSSLATGYDREQNLGRRLAALYDALAGLKSMPRHELHDRYHEEVPALVANRELLFQMPATFGHALARRLLETA